MNIRGGKFSMKKELIGIFVCIMLIISIVPSINAIESKNTDIKSKNDGEVDLVIYGEGWWSPAPWLEDEDFLGLYYQIENIGYRYQGNNWIYLSIYFIYPDHEEVYIENRGVKSSDIMVGLQWSSMGKSLKKEKPEEIRFEIETNAPESNKQNNNLTVKVDYGVTIYGKIYIRNLRGEQLHKKWVVLCNSDISLKSFKYEDAHFYDNNYVVVAPKKAGAPPFCYTLIARIDYFLLRTRLKITPKLDEFEYTEIDFNFGFSDRSVNPINRLFQRLPNLFLIFKQLMRI